MVVFVFEIGANDDDALEAVNLHGSQGSANFVRPGVLPVDTGVSHILDELAGFVRDDMNSLRFLAQVRIWQGNDSFFLHNFIL